LRTSQSVERSLWNGKWVKSATEWGFPAKYNRRGLVAKSAQTPKRGAPILDARTIVLVIADDDRGRRVPLAVRTDSSGSRWVDVPRMAVLDTMGAVIVVEIEGDAVAR